MEEAMSANSVRILAIAAILLAFCILASALALGGEVPMIFVGLMLAAGSMALFRRANPAGDDD
jgi:hypothetical protein